MYEVIAEFVDKNTGERIRPGQPLPETMDRDQLGRLLRAKCLKRLPAQAGLLGEGPVVAKKALAKGTPKKSATKAAKPKAAAGEGGSSQAGFLPDDDPATVAGGDGGDPGQRTEPDGRGRKRRKG